MTGRSGGHFLVVCSANQCRSPLTAAMLGARCDQLELGILVDSAGVQAIRGVPATPPTIDAAAGLGLDLSAHRSRPLTPEMTQSADLVLTMERRHVQEVVLATPEAFPRTFTLKELVRRGSAVGPRAPDESFAGWLERVHEGRRPADLLGASDDDDVADPTGRVLADHRSTASEIDALTTAFLELLVPQR
jgi:protein-tyrosine phosphatase